MSITHIKQELSEIETDLRRQIGELPELKARLTAGPEVSLGELIDTMTQYQLCKHPLYLRLMRLDAALCQLEIGLYGVCSDCESQIEPERLARDPLEQRCEHCSDLHEQEHRQELRLTH